MNRDILRYLTLITCLSKFGECQEGVPCSYPWHGISLKSASISECKKNCGNICASSFGHFDSTRPERYQHLCFSKYLQSEGYIDNGACVCGIHFKLEGSFETCDLQPPVSASASPDICDYYCKNTANVVAIEHPWQSQLVTCYESSTALHAVPLVGFCRQTNAPSMINTQANHICQCAFPENWAASGMGGAGAESMRVDSNNTMEAFLLRDDDTQFDGNHPELSTLYKSLEDVLVTTNQPTHIPLPPSNQIAIMKVRDPEKFIRCDKQVWNSPDITLQNRGSLHQCNEICTGWCHNYRSYYSTRKKRHICYTHKRPSIGIFNGEKCRCAPTYNYANGKINEYCAKANSSDMRTVVGAPRGLICEDFCSRNVFTYVVDRPDYQKLIECVQRTVKQPDEVARSLKGFCRGTRINDQSRMVCQCGQVSPPLYKEQLSDIQIPESEMIYPVMIGTYLSTKTKVRPLSIFMLEKYGTPDRIKEMLEQYKSSELRRTQSDFTLLRRGKIQNDKNKSDQRDNKKGHRKHQSVPFLKHTQRSSVSGKNDPSKIYRGKENISKSSHRTQGPAGTSTSLPHNLQSPLPTHHLQQSPSPFRAQPSYIDLTKSYVPDATHIITSDAYPDITMRNISQNQQALVNENQLWQNQFTYGSQNMSVDTAINSQNISMLQRYQYPITLPAQTNAQYYPQNQTNPQLLYQTNPQLLYQTNPQLFYQTNPQAYPNNAQFYPTNSELAQSQRSNSVHVSSKPQGSQHSQMSNSVSQLSRSIHIGEVSSRLQNIPKDKGKQPATSSTSSLCNKIAHFGKLDTSAPPKKSRKEKYSSEAVYPSKRPHIDVLSKLSDFGMKDPANKYIERFFQLN